MHRHINTNDRPVIASMLRAGYQQKDIALTLGFSKGAISKEIKRNIDEDGVYRVHQARRKARQRRESSKVKYRKVDTELSKLIEKRLNPLVSPEVVAHEMDLCHQTVYTHIYRDRPELIPQLPQRGRKRRRYGSKRAKKQGWTQKVKSIHDKPPTAISWEGDTIKGKTRSRILTHVEYTSLYTKADLLPDGTADSVQAALKKRPVEGNAIYDRGSEFALWQMIERDCSIEVFFADAYSPWQRGKNENTNGRLRRVFPKRLDFATITNRQLQKVVQTMNHTPRKSLNWRTPAEVYESLLSK